jgi:hypothetical protein
MADIVKGPLAETSFDREKALRADLACVTAERDALRAEVEAMRAVVEAARPLAKILPGAGVLRAAIDALDALRAKVGG